jgi:CRP-like cAMP-binding protein
MPNFLNHGNKTRKSENPEALIHFPAGVDVVDSRHLARYVYLLRSGQVRLSSGEAAVLDYLTPGDFFGEEWLVTPRRRVQIAKSLSPVTVSVFRSSQLLDRVQKDRRFALRLLRNLACRLDRYRLAIRDFVTEPAERRLARRLSWLASARPASGWVRLRCSPSNAELAKTIGTTRWRISYFMRHFQQLGWLQRRPEIWIHREGLAEYLETGSKPA